MPFYFCSMFDYNTRLHRKTYSDIPCMTEHVGLFGCLLIYYSYSSWYFHYIPRVHSSERHPQMKRLETFNLQHPINNKQ